MMVGSLFSGYGGLDLALRSIWGDVEVAWVSDVCRFDKDGNAGHRDPHRAPCSILAHRLPGVPNLGDVAAVDWSAVAPVDILTGGTPCQDLSTAGRRAGMTEGTRSNLWVAMREAIDTLRPRLVVWENVAGAYSAGADSELVTDARLLADTRRRDGEPVLRALGRVLGDLASLGYDAAWTSLRAADVGAPHGRLRVFLLAWPAADAERGGRSRWTSDPVGSAIGGAAAAGGGQGSGGSLLPPPSCSDTNGPGQHGDGGLDLRTAISLMPTPRAGDDCYCELGYECITCARRRIARRQTDVTTLPTPTARDWKNVGDPAKTAGRMADRGQPLGEVVVNALLPTPAVNDMGAAYTPDEWDAWTDRMKAEHGNGNGHGKSLNIEAQRLLPTPRTQNNENRQSEGYGGEGGNFYGLLTGASRWGDYASAIARWEATLGRPAPAPTMTSAKGNPQLSPAFVEWMMGLPAGWVTDVPGITRNEALKALGNGVVPQQAEAAVRWLWQYVPASVRAGLLGVAA